METIFKGEQLDKERIREWKEDLAAEKDETRMPLVQF